MEWRRIDMSKQLTQEEFIAKVKSNNKYYANGDFEILNEYTKNTGMIICHCNICNNDWTTTAQILKAGCGCPNKSRHSGFLLETHPDVAKMLANPEDGNKVKHYQDIYLDWICPDCGSIIKHKLCSNVVRHGLVCNVCKETRSMGHRTMCAVLEQLKENYVTEKMFDWSEKRIYDIYLPDKKCIIEVNGIQHYKTTIFHKQNKKSLDDQIAIDSFKMKIAKDNGILNYIIIDSRESNINYIINSIKNNKDFIKSFDISNIDWELVVMKTFSKSKIEIMDFYKKGFTVKEIYNMYNNKFTFNYISNTVNSFLEVGLCKRQKHKRIICLDTGEIFDNYTDASKRYNVSDTSISSVCRKVKNRRTAGKDENGNHLHWSFEDDINISISSTNKKTGARKVVCLNTLEIFPMIKKAREKYPNAKSISDCCRNISKHSGELNGELLVWAYYDDYLKMTQEDIEHKLSYPSKNCKIVCLTTNNIFNGYKEASSYFDIDYQTLYNAINYGNKMTSENNRIKQRLTWCKYEDLPNNYYKKEVV